MASTLIAVLTASLAVYTFALALLRLTQHYKEPPAIDTSVPFITPLFNLGRKGYEYWGLNSRWPAYTLRLPFMRLYVINSPTLIQAVQRRVRTISFSPIQVSMASSAMALSPSAVDIISQDPLDDHGFVMGFSKTIRAMTNPGPKLDLLNRRSVQILANSLDRLVAAQRPMKLDMNRWISLEVMLASTDGVYGPKNPFKDPLVQKAFYEYEAGFVPLMMNVLPSITARKSLKARGVLVDAYRRYYDAQGQAEPDCSELMRARYEFCSRNGISDADIAKIETTSSIALLSNTMPATFWLVYHIFSDPGLLDACRLELAQAVKEVDGVHTVDMARVKDACPLLLSTFQEVLRFYGIGVSTRMVLEDTMLDSHYLFRKDAILFIPGAAQHRLKASWGENAGDFDPRRFLPQPGTNGRTYDPVSFRGFGGGSTLCPGRHFAATEILTFSSLIILRFQAKPITGRWLPPTTKKTNPGTTIRQPDYDIEIEVRPRGDAKWAVQFSGSNKPMMVSTEDIVENDAGDGPLVQIKAE